MTWENLVTPVWISFLVALVLAVVRKWLCDLAEAVKKLDERMGAYEKAQHACQIDLARNHATKGEVQRLWDRTEDHGMRLTRIEERA